VVPGLGGTGVDGLVHAGPPAPLERDLFAISLMRAMWCALCAAPLDLLAQFPYAKRISAQLRTTARQACGRSPFRGSECGSRRSAATQDSDVSVVEQWTICSCWNRG